MMNIYVNARNKDHGFTLIEVLVSVSIFSIVMLVATGAVFSIVAANKKAHAIKSVMTNLDFALESMSRNIRVGSTYRCIDSAGGVVTDPQYGDCVNGNVGLQFTSNIPTGSLNSGNYPLKYTYATDANGVGRIYRQFIGIDASPVAITAPEIHVTSMKFYVTNVASAEKKQPKMVIVIQGYAGQDTDQSEFKIETTVSQRSIGA